MAWRAASDTPRRPRIPVGTALASVANKIGEDAMTVRSVTAIGSVDNVVARIERLPTSWWHVKTRIIVGVATFFDAFDALAIASVLPVIVPLWKLTPPQIGLMISAGFLGQLLGALLFAWIA